MDLSIPLITLIYQKLLMWIGLVLSNYFTLSKRVFSFYCYKRFLFFSLINEIIDPWISCQSFKYIIFCLFFLDWWSKFHSNCLFLVNYCLRWLFKITFLLLWKEAIRAIRILVSHKHLLLSFLLIFLLFQFPCQSLILQPYMLFLYFRI